MQSSLRKLVAVMALFVVVYQPACSSDDGDDNGDDGGGGSGGSSGASGSGGTSGGGPSNCDPPCASDETCQGCFNPDNPDMPLWACIGEGVSC